MTTGVIVVAKAPIPGYAKTRLAAVVGAQRAAAIAAAALLDTLDAVETFTSGPRPKRMISLAGDLAEAASSGQLAARCGRWVVVPQRGSTLSERLVHAHQDASATWGDDVTLIQIGMDTPQLRPHDLKVLEASTSQRRVALGPADDGGWWGIAGPGSRYAGVLRNVLTSTPTTGTDTVRALQRAGAAVSIVHQLSDLDTWPDALRIAALIPTSRTAEAVHATAEQQRPRLTVSAGSRDG